MPSCPQCGTPQPAGAAACARCGAAYPSSAAAGVADAKARAPAGRTLLGLEPPKATSLPADAAQARPQRTILGLSASTIAAGTPASVEPPAASGAQAAHRTMLGIAPPPTAAPGPPAGAAWAPGSGTLLGVAAHAAPDPAAAVPAGAPAGAKRTLLGVAMPGIAPTRPGNREAHPAAPTPEPAPAPAFASAAAQLPAPAPGGGLDAFGAGAPAGAAAARGAAASPGAAHTHELGATVGPGRDAWAPSARALDRRMLHAAPAALVPRPGREKPAGSSVASRRATAVVIAAVGLAIAAVLFAIFWPSPPPLTARARTGDGGGDALEIRCASCPDGTVLKIGDATATVAGGASVVPLAAPLSVGDNLLKVAVDRPGSGRDETVSVRVGVAYRIRPELDTLQAEAPAIQIVVEAQPGSSVTLNGKPATLSGGRAVETLDVTASCTGVSDEPATLSRRIPYVVTPPDGDPERGTVDVSVGIVPLSIDAPGPNAVVAGQSFVLAGRTLRGAEVLAAGRPITVKPDGTFAQIMNVSSVGSTQIEVRARMPKLAPRMTRIGVRRVDSLESAARDFASSSPIGYAEAARDITAAVGKPVAVAGEVMDLRRQGHVTVMLLDVPASHGCKTAGPCSVRLVQGTESGAKPGDRITAYGRVARAHPFPGRGDVPEVQVDFVLKGLR